MTSSEEIARRFAEKRPGFVVVSFAEVGLPYYRVRLRAQVLERKPVPPMEEIVLLAIERELSQREVIRNLLGLDPPLFEGVLAELLRKEYIVLGPSSENDLALTELGAKVFEDSREIRPTDLGLEVHFDALTRKAVPSVAGLVDARRMDSIGLREVPPARPRPPGLADLDPEAVQRISMRYPGPGGATADLLALKRIDRRNRVFRPATILVYRGEERKEAQVAFVVDEEISAEHGIAFSDARLTTKMGVRASAMEDPIELFTQIFERGYDGPEPDRLACFDLPAQLDSALGEPRGRVLIVSPRVTPEIVAPDFRDSLRRRLVEGAQVFIGVGPARGNPKAAELDQQAMRPLEELYRRFNNFQLRRFPRPGPALLAVDSEWAILTRFNWLGYEGDLERTYLDERGLPLRTSRLVDELFERQVQRF